MLEIDWAVTLDHDKHCNSAAPTPAGHCQSETKHNYAGHRKSETKQLAHLHDAKDERRRDADVLDECFQPLLQQHAHAQHFQVVKRGYVQSKIQWGVKSASLHSCMCPRAPAHSFRRHAHPPARCSVSQKSQTAQPGTPWPHSCHACGPARTWTVPLPCSPRQPPPAAGPALACTVRRFLSRTLMLVLCSCRLRISLEMLPRSDCRWIKGREQYRKGIVQETASRKRLTRGADLAGDVAQARLRQEQRRQQQWLWHAEQHKAGGARV